MRDKPLLEPWWLNLLTCTVKSNIGRTLVGNKIVDHSDIVGASPVGAAPTTSSFSTEHMALMNWAKTTARRDKNIYVWGWGAPYIRELTVYVCPKPHNVGVSYGLIE